VGLFWNRRDSIAGSAKGAELVITARLRIEATCGSVFKEAPASIEDNISFVLVLFMCKNLANPGNAVGCSSVLRLEARAEPAEIKCQAQRNDECQFRLFRHGYHPGGRDNIERSGASQPARSKNLKNFDNGVSRAAPTPIRRRVTQGRSLVRLHL
jgi:hypothetical protein